MRSDPAAFDYDVAVVGASCAGLATARDLARSGARVAVLDSRPDFSAPSRTWIVTRKLGDVLDLDVGPSVVHETPIMEMVARRARRTVRLDPADWIVERSELRRLLAKAAEAAGVEILLRHRVREIGRSGGGIAIAFGRNGHSGALRARDLVGADGTKSLVAAAVGAAPQRTVPIVQARVRLPAGWDPAVTRVWFEPHRTRFFYWLIPENAEVGVLGLIAERSDDARALLDGFLAEQSLVPLEYQGAMIPLHQRGRRIDWTLGGSRVLLVGDAAAHVKVTTVGGVVSGVWGARAAARAIARGTRYGAELAGLRRELMLHDTVRWFMDRFEMRHYERLLDLLNPRLTDLLGRHDRDSLAPRTLALLAAQPAVAALALDVMGAPRGTARRRLTRRVRGLTRPIGTPGAEALEPAD